MAAVVGRLSSEIREMELDEQGTHRVAEVHARVVTALREALDEELMAELDQLAPGLGEATASETDVRVAQAQLTGWLDGLFQGFQLQVAAARPVAGHDPRGERPALPPDHEPGAGTYL